MPLFLFFNTQTMHIHTALLWFPKKPYTLAGFEPGSFIPEVNAMSTAPRRQGIIFLMLHMCDYIVDELLYYDSNVAVCTNSVSRDFFLLKTWLCIRIKIFA
jgi:hypothetical protein